MQVIARFEQLRSGGGKCGARLLFNANGEAEIVSDVSSVSNSLAEAEVGVVTKKQPGKCGEKRAEVVVACKSCGCAGTMPSWVADKFNFRICSLRLSQLLQIGKFKNEKVKKTNFTSCC